MQRRTRLAVHLVQKAAYRKARQAGCPARPAGRGETAGAVRLRGMGRSSDMLPKVIFGHRRYNSDEECFNQKNLPIQASRHGWTDPRLIRRQLFPHCLVSSLLHGLQESKVAYRDDRRNLSSSAHDQHRISSEGRVIPSLALWAAQRAPVP